MNVYLSPLSEYKLIRLTEYLEEEWGKSSKLKFLKMLQNKFQQVSEHPESNSLIEGFNSIRWCVVSHQVSFYYRIDRNENAIEVITITDNRQDPEKIIKEIRKHFKP